MDLQLEGRRALITGSTSGIGEATAKVLATEGVSVAIHGRDRDRGERVAAEIRDGCPMRATPATNKIYAFFQHLF